MYCRPEYNLCNTHSGYLSCCTAGVTGAYLGFLLQLKQLLELSCGPIVATLPALEHNAQPHAVYGRPEAALRWEHPFFEDIRTSKFPDYGQVQPSKYAEKVKVSQNPDQTHDL